MARKFQFVTHFLCCWLCVAASFGFVGGCSPQHYKDDADQEVYKIIDDKWNEDLGEKVNYRISDVLPSPHDLQVEKVVPASGVVNLTEAVAIATAYNRQYLTEKENLYLTALDLTLVRYDFARQWFGTIDAAYVNNSEDSVIKGEQISSGGELGFDQLLADGAAISTSIAIDWSRFLTGDPDTSLASVLSASITQPLLRGAGRKIVQENLTQAERNALYQLRAFSRFRKSFVVSIITDYYRVLQIRDAITNAENNYNRRVESRQRLEMEADAGRTPRFEVDQAKQSELDALDSLVQLQQSYQQQLDEFKIRLSLPTDANMELDQNELKALEKIGLVEPDYTLDAAIETALLGRLDLATARDSVDDAERKVVVAADGLGAELNLVGSAGVGSSGKTDFTRLQFHNGTYLLGLEADLPLDRKVERNAYRESLIALQQRERDYENTQDQVKLDVRQDYRQLGEAAERYRIQKNSLDLAERRVESTKMLLAAGRAQTRDLLDSQDSLVEAQNRVTAALVEHAVAKLNFFLDIEVLQVKPDGMWEQLNPPRRIKALEPENESSQCGKSS